MAVTDARGAAPAVQPVARLQARAEAMTATQVRQISRRERRGDQRRHARRRAAPIPPAPPFSLANASAADRARSLDCLTVGHLLRIRHRAARRPARGRPGDPQPRPPPGLSEHGLRRGLRRARSAGPAASSASPATARCAAADADLLGARPRGRRGGAQRLCLCPGRPRAQLSRQLCRAQLVLEPGPRTPIVGLHIFYRWRGNQGRPAAFTDAYAGAEPAIAWRGGFGQPTRGARRSSPPSLRSARTPGRRDRRGRGGDERRPPDRRAAAHASVDSFQRSVLRRYEPLQRESAAAVINESAPAASRPLSTSQRWALTGQSGTTTQQPLGRRPAEARPQPPPELQGVRRRASARRRRSRRQRE